MNGIKKIKKSSNPKILLWQDFSGNIFLINTASQVWMMTEIRRSEKYQVVLWGWAQFTAPQPQQNYLTSLLIKSAFGAAHHNGGLIYSVHSELSSVQWRLCSSPLRPPPLPPLRSAVSLQAYGPYNIHDSCNMETDSDTRIALVFALHYTKWPERESLPHTCIFFLQIISF